MKRILLVEDNDHLRETLSEVLTRAGYDVEEASNGSFALKAFRQAPSDLVITDLIMPNMEGLETIGRLRRNWPAVKIIAMSGGGRGSARSYLDAAAAMGAHRTIEKPFSGDDILGAVAEVLECTT